MFAQKLREHAVLITSICIVLLITLSGALVYGYQKHTALQSSLLSLQNEHSATREALREAEQKVVDYGATLEQIQQAYALSEENGTELLEMLTQEKNRNEEFAAQINDITGTVGKLDKLSKIDQELLMKYSKVYFLNEHYVPAKITEIPEEFRSKKSEPEYISAQVAPFLFDLIEEAKEDGIELLVVSGYRSFDEQKSLKSAYSVQYGSGANTFSADQGYSEHQLGTTIDFTTTGLGGGLGDFEDTEAYTWLQENAHRFGFILSYPERNGYYIFEPWHWRFVGKDLADDLHDDKTFFYDLDQRAIDEYLISLFD